MIRRLFGIGVIGLQLVALLWAAVPTVTYWLRPEVFAAACENKDKPCLHCCGKCKLRQATARAMGVGGQAWSDEKPSPKPSSDSWGLSPFRLGWTSSSADFLDASYRRAFGRAPSPEPPPPKV